MVKRDVRLSSASMAIFFWLQPMLYVDNLVFSHFCLLSLYDLRLLSCLLCVFRHALLSCKYTIFVRIISYIILVVESAHLLQPPIGMFQCRQTCLTSEMCLFRHYRSYFMSKKPTQVWSLISGCEFFIQHHADQKGALYKTR